MYKNLIKEDHYVTQGWNAWRWPYYRYWEYRHKGIDFGTHNKKVPFYAIVDGMVMSSGLDGGWGLKLELYNKELDRYFVHAHADSLNTFQGEGVKKGDQLGIVGTTGFSDGIHLHFGVYKKTWHGKQWEDPTPYLINPLTEAEMIIQNLSEVQKKRIKDLQEGKTILAFADGKTYVIRDSKKKELPPEEALINVLAAGTTKENIDKIPNS